MNPKTFNVNTVPIRMASRYMLLNASICEDLITGWALVLSRLHMSVF